MADMALYNLDALLGIPHVLSESKHIKYSRLELLVCVDKSDRLS